MLVTVIRVRCDISKSMRGFPKDIEFQTVSIPNNKGMEEC